MILGDDAKKFYPSPPLYWGVTKHRTAHAYRTEIITVTR